jgi:uncharacterized membrane protein YkvI
MLDGIEVLNKAEVMELPIWVSVVIIVLFIISLLSLGMGVVDAIEDITDGHCWIFIVVTTVAYIALLIMGNADSQLLTEPTGVYEYQVTIDDSVSMTEFLEKYEIIEVNGKIYTIREKE